MEGNVTIIILQVGIHGLDFPGRIFLAGFPWPDFPE